MSAAHTSLFELEGAKAEVIHLNYSFSRTTDPEKGQPTKVVRNGRITLTIRSDSKEMKGKILKWMGAQDKPKEGKITIFRDAEQQQKFREIQFTNAFVVKYDETFDSRTESDNTIETFEITAEKIKVEDTEFKMKWPEAE